MKSGTTIKLDPFFQNLIKRERVVDNAKNASIKLTHSTIVVNTIGARPLTDILFLVFILFVICIALEALWLFKSTSE